MGQQETVLAFERRRKIVETVNQRRSITVDELIGLFPVSPITIRRDLDQLAEEGTLRRVHGGAVALANIVVAPRASEHAGKLSEAQLRIGEDAARRIADGDFIIIESGSTCQAVIPHLAGKKNLKVVTASHRIAMMLGEIAERHPQALEVMSSGGILNVYKDFLMGPHARSFFEGIRVDLAFISPTALDLGSGITADSLNEAEITRTIIERSAKRKIGLVVAAKFDTVSFVQVAPVESLDEIITDRSIDPTLLARYTEKGIRVVLV
jgi:DeoR family transcriptional regulator, fructose operon transcriptional repressor